ncbi:hydroxypyruvate isomerase family protein [Candidatus Rhodobacter oscarellae]|uniref:hydroxypyruvate isomerase family protein n=1 Tax=Candidatus Rhodobacter oscarellae TaxID=1675527 RepID=UPI002E165877
MTFLFKEFPFLERFEAAAEAGFEGAEVLFPYDDAATAIVRSMRHAELPLVMMNAPPPNWAGGERGFAATPGGRARFQKDLRRTMRYAERLKPQHIHLMAGKAQGAEARETYIRNLAWAAAEVPEQSFVIEPVNPAGTPGYFLDSFELAEEILAEIDAPNLGLLFDCYHAQLICGDLMEAWRRFGKLARHVQVASAPGRREPSEGGADFQSFFDLLDAEGYPGFVSAEYQPRGRTRPGLDWMIKGTAS